MAGNNPRRYREERSYIYDGREHMPIVSGLPQAYILVGADAGRKRRAA